MKATWGIRFENRISLEFLQRDKAWLILDKLPLGYMSAFLIPFHDIFIQPASGSENLSSMQSNRSRQDRNQNRHTRTSGGNSRNRMFFIKSKLSLSGAASNSTRLSDVQSRLERQNARTVWRRGSDIWAEVSQEAVFRCWVKHAFHSFVCPLHMHVFFTALMSLNIVSFPLSFDREKCLIFPTRYALTCCSEIAAATLTKSPTDLVRRASSRLVNYSSFRNNMNCQTSQFSP